MLRRDSALGRVGIAVACFRTFFSKKMFTEKCVARCFRKSFSLRFCGSMSTSNPAGGLAERQGDMVRLQTILGSCSLTP